MDEKSITDIRQTIELLRMQHGNSHGSQEQQRIQAYVSDPELKEIVSKLSIASFHTLSALEMGEQTGIEIAGKINVTRGGVTRAAKKLQEYGLINALKHNDDKKKIYYSLTENGRKIAEAHDQMTEALKKELVDKLTAKYSSEELKTVAEFLNDLYELERNF